MEREISHGIPPHYAPTTVAAVAGAGNSECAAPDAGTDASAALFAQPWDRAKGNEKGASRSPRLVREEGYRDAMHGLPHWCVSIALESNVFLTTANLTLALKQALRNFVVFEASKPDISARYIVLLSANWLVKSSITFDFCSLVIFLNF